MTQATAPTTGRQSNWPAMTAVLLLVIGFTYSDDIVEFALDLSGRTFADAGAHVTVTGTRASAEAYDTDLAGLAYHRLETTDPASIDALIASLDRLDVLVNNAGATFPGGRDEWEPETFAAALRLNLEGPMQLTTGCRALLADSALDGGASVVSIVSMSAFRAVPLVPG